MVLRLNTKDEARETVVKSICETGRDVTTHSWRWQIAKRLIKFLKEDGLIKVQIYDKEMISAFAIF